MFDKVIRLFRTLLIFHLLMSFSCLAQDNTIKAAVAEGFIDGLHSKYLHYIADKLSLPIAITAIPFARRIKEVELGRLDIIVGLQKTESRQDAFIYIHPSYESLSYRFFSLSENSHEFKRYEDLKGKLIGVNRHSKYFKPFDHDKHVRKFETKNLEQNIKLILYGRIDLFIHYKESTLPKLKELGVTEQINEIPYQPESINEYYIAISKYSALVKRKEELQSIVINGLANNDFLRIRQKHYAQKILN